MDYYFTSKEVSILLKTPIQYIRKIVKKYDLGPICFHKLRHTSASILITKGINPKGVSQRLGHADTSITMEIYTHTFDTTKKECVNALEDVLKKA